MRINRGFYLFIHDIDKQRTKCNWQDSRCSFRSIGSLVVDNSHDGFPSDEDTDCEDQQDSEHAEGVVGSLTTRPLQQRPNTVRTIISTNYRTHWVFWVPAPPHSIMVNPVG